VPGLRVEDHAIGKVGYLVQRMGGSRPACAGGSRPPTYTLIAVVVLQRGRHTWHRTMLAFIPAALGRVCAPAFRSALVLSLLLASVAQAQFVYDAVAFGSNSDGQVVIAPTDTSVRAVAAGRFHTVVLLDDGTVKCFGRNVEGQSAVPPGLAGVVAVAAGGTHTLALRDDGTVVAWGANNFGQSTVPAGATGVVAIAAGAGHSLALRSNGSIVAWGFNFYGQLNTPAGSGPFLKIAAGDFHSVALTFTGQPVAWGDNSWGQCTVPAGVGACSSIAAGGQHTVVLRNFGLVAAWGRNDAGQCTIPAGLGACSYVAGGGLHTIVQRTDGVVVAFGDDSQGQSSVPTGVPANGVAAGSRHSVVVRNRDCNGNLVIDTAELGANDCNSDQRIDACQVANGFLVDTNLDGVPDICQNTPTLYCFGAPATCPCGSSGDGTGGCGNNFSALGGRLVAEGTASVAADSLVLRTSRVGAFAPVLYFQGTTVVNGGAGAVFGDGLRCAGGAVWRLGIRISSGGLSSFPPPGGAVSVSGLVPATGGMRTYQAWYRDQTPGFCTPSTFNLTNGVSLRWTP